MTRLASDATSFDQLRDARETLTQIAEVRERELVPMAGPSRDAAAFLDALKLPPTAEGRRTQRAAVQLARDLRSESRAVARVTKSMTKVLRQIDKALPDESEGG